MQYKFYLYIIILLGLISINLNNTYAQNNISKDSALIKAVNDTIKEYYRLHPYKLKPKANKVKIKPTFGLSYSNERKFGAIAGFKGQYRNGRDTTTLLSSFNLYTQITTNLSVVGNFSGINYSFSDKLITEYFVGYNRSPLYFWGIGYENNVNNDNKSTFLENAVNVRCDLLYHATKSIRFGGMLGYNYFLGDKFSNPEIIEGYSQKSSALNFGLLFAFDNRNSINFPERGIFFRFEQLLYSDLIETNNPYYKTKIIADFYLPIWEKIVLAFDVFGEFNYGKTNWTAWSEFGGENRMRGYYQGRFRDKNTISGQMELRAMFGIHGPVAWFGAGNIFNSAKTFNIKNTLPTYGVGYRVLLAGTMFRIDIGFGNKGNYGIYAGINQAF